MLHSVARKYCFADVKVFKKFNVYFVQAANKNITIWRFCLCDAKLYSIYRCSSSEVTLNYKESEDCLKNILNNMWAFNVSHYTYWYTI